MTDKRYRHGVCIVIRNRNGGKVLLCHRCGFPVDEGWQFPQGGVDERLELVEEAKRELREEIGADTVSVLRVSEKSYCYEFPGKICLNNGCYDGQCHRWLLVEFEGEDSGISFSHEPAEFDAFEWVEPDEALTRIVGFKQDAYKAALADFGLIHS